MLKREWGAERNGKLPHLFIPSNTATLVSEFAVEDMPLVRTAALVPEFAVKHLPLGKTLMMMMMMMMICINKQSDLTFKEERFSRTLHPNCTTIQDVKKSVEYFERW